MGSTVLLVVFLALAGICAVVWGVLAWRLPRGVVWLVKAFPRNRAAGWGLCAACVVWICMLLRGMNMGFLEWLKPWVWPLGAVTFAAVVWALEELLAVRALGGMLLLAASPALSMLYFAENPPARVWMWHDVAAALVYAAILLGALWLLRPWTWRTAGEWLAARPRIRKLAAATAVVAGAALLTAAADVWLLSVASC